MDIHRYNTEPYSTWESGADSLMQSIQKFGEDNARVAVQEVINDMTFCGYAMSKNFPPDDGIVVVAESADMGVFGIECGLASVIDDAFSNFFNTTPEDEVCKAEFTARLDATEAAIRRAREGLAKLP